MRIVVLFLLVALTASPCLSADDSSKIFDHEFFKWYSRASSLHSSESKIEDITFLALMDEERAFKIMDFWMLRSKVSVMRDSPGSQAAKSAELDNRFDAYFFDNWIKITETITSAVDATKEDDEVFESWQKSYAWAEASEVLKDLDDIRSGKMPKEHESGVIDKILRLSHDGKFKLYKMFDIMASTGESGDKRQREKLMACLFALTKDQIERVNYEIGKEIEMDKKNVPIHERRKARGKIQSTPLIHLREEEKAIASVGAWNPPTSQRVLFDFFNKKDIEGTFNKRENRIKGKSGSVEYVGSIRDDGLAEIYEVTNGDLGSRFIVELTLLDKEADNSIAKKGTAWIPQWLQEFLGAFKVRSSTQE